MAAQRSASSPRKPKAGPASRRAETGPRFADDEITEAVMTWHVTAGSRELSFFTMMSTLGTPLDITLAELAIEMFFPADAATEESLRSRGSGQMR